MFHRVGLDPFVHFFVQFVVKPKICRQANNGFFFVSWRLCVRHLFAARQIHQHLILSIDLQIPSSNHTPHNNLRLNLTIHPKIIPVINIFI